MNDDDKTVFLDTRYPYDVVKIITSSVVGEPRLKFVADDDSPTNYTLSAFRYEHDRKKLMYRVRTEFLHKIDANLDKFCDDASFIDTPRLEVNDFGRLFYEYGKLSLGFLCATIIGTGLDGKREPLGQNFELAFERLYSASERRPFEFLDLVDQYAENVETFRSLRHVMFDPKWLYTNLMECHKLMEHDPGYEIPASDVLAGLYMSLYSMLLGMIIISHRTAVLDLPDILRQPTTRLTDCERIISVLIESESTDIETKKKTLGLFLMFNELTIFFDHYFKRIEDPIALLIANVGKTLLSKNDDISDDGIYDYSALDQHDLDYKKSFLDLISWDEPIESIFTVIARTPIYGVGNRFVLASGLYKYHNTTSPVETVIHAAYLNDSDVLKFTDENVEALYFSFIRDFLSAIPHEICPNWYSILTRIALTFRLALNSDISAHSKDTASLGLWQAEAAQVAVYHEWFHKSKTYKTSPAVRTSKNTAHVNALAAQYSILVDINQYANAVTELGSKEGDRIYYGGYGRQVDLYVNFFASTINQNELFNPETLIIEHSMKMNDENLDDVIKALATNELAPIQVYIPSGYDPATYGLLTIRTQIEHDPQADKIYEVISNLPTDAPNHPILRDDLISYMTSQNVKKIKSLFSSDAPSGRIGILMSALFKVIFMIGFIKEELYETIDRGRYIEQPFDSNDNVTAIDMDYGTIIPRILVQKPAFSFLK